MTRGSGWCVCTHRKDRHYLDGVCKEKRCDCIEYEDENDVRE